MVAAPETPSGVLALLEELVRSDKPDLLDSSTYAIIARLRRFNREAHNRVNEQRQITLDTRNNMDQTHLGLQNLLYERRHLEREIQKCLDFQFIYQDIDLHGLDEFESLAPEAANTIDEHELMKNRLEFEFTERRRLEERKKELVAERNRLQKLKKDNRSRMDAESREEGELAKKADSLDQILSALAIASAAPSPATPNNSALPCAPAPAIFAVQSSPSAIPTIEAAQAIAPVKAEAMDMN